MPFLIVAVLNVLEGRERERERGWSLPGWHAAQTLLPASSLALPAQPHILLTSLFIWYSVTQGHMKAGEADGCSTAITASFLEPSM